MGRSSVSKINKNLSFEEDMLPPFINSRNLAGYITDEQYFFITDEKSLSFFKKKVKQESYDFLSKEYISNK